MIINTFKSRPARLGALAAAMVLTMAGAAEAHTGLGHTSGFMHGAMHPISGLDHVLAMIAVGLLAAQLGGRALWVVPLSFMSMMGVGGALGFSGVEIPFIEFGIAASVLVLGALVALNMRLQTAIAASLAAAFAIFHGYAHGAEIPADVGGAAYMAGFVTSTGLLHLTGIALAILATKALSKGLVLNRLAGSIIAVAGIGLMTGAI